VCLKLCPLNKCPDAYVSIDEITRKTKLFVIVDGAPVIDVRRVDGNCIVLIGEHGTRFGKRSCFSHWTRYLYALKVSSIIVF